MKLNSILIPTLVLATAGAFAGSATADQHGGGPAMRLEALDTNADGAISREEIDAARRERFTEADTDGNSILSEEEFTVAMEARAEERRNRRRGNAFERADSNGDGGLTFDETGTRLESMFERVDTDGDGLITEAEMEAAKSAMGRRRGEGPRERRAPSAE